jgi:hypothetical protein
MGRRAVTVSAAGCAPWHLAQAPGAVATQGGAQHTGRAAVLQDRAAPGMPGGAPAGSAAAPRRVHSVCYARLMHLHDGLPCCLLPLLRALQRPHTCRAPPPRPPRASCALTCMSNSNQSKQLAYSPFIHMRLGSWPSPRQPGNVEAPQRRSCGRPGERAHAHGAAHGRHAWCWGGQDRYMVVWAPALGQWVAAVAASAAGAVSRDCRVAHSSGEGGGVGGATKTVCAIEKQWDRAEDGEDVGAAQPLNSGVKK